HKVGHIDCMLMEGTTLGGKHHDGYNDEAAVEDGMVKAFQHDHATFVLGSGSNVDWLVSLYRATKRTNKLLVLDLYQFYLLTRLKQFTPALPPHDGDHVRILYTKYQAERLEQHDLVNIMTKDAVRRKISREEICGYPEKMVVRLSMGEMKRLADKMDEQDNMRFVYSMWQGYLERDSDMADFPRQYGCEWQSIHTSGHAWLEDLQQLISKIEPDRVIPIHTLQGDKFEKYFENVVRVKDGEEVVLNEKIVARLEDMCKWAKERRNKALDVKDAYVRIGGNGFRAVSVAEATPLTGYVTHTAKTWDTVCRHFSNDTPENVDSKSEERRLQAYMIRESLKSDNRLCAMIGKEFGDVKFDEILFAFDEVSLGDSHNKVKFGEPINGQTEGVIRCDLLCVGVIDGKGYPILVELKYDRQLKRLLEQLHEFSRFVNGVYKKQFSDLLSAATGIEVDCDKCYKMMVWPPCVKEPTKTTKDKLKASDVKVIEYKITDTDENEFLTGASFEYKSY
ncbi:MAG: MBL fold metallo-hydrolase RNA specificity domain-containing protein, partial [Mariprofundus sp.]